MQTILTHDLPEHVKDLLTALEEGSVKALNHCVTVERTDPETEETHSLCVSIGTTAKTIQLFPSHIEAVELFHNPDLQGYIENFVQNQDAWL